MTCTARVHGTQTAYERSGCRCPVAVEEMRAKWRRDAARRARGRAAGGGRQRSDGIDEVSVLLACHGGPPLLGRDFARERREVVRRLTAAGLSQRQIAVRMGVTPRTVCRHRAALRAVAS
jgi:DNA invertase Pin-like site-specific DNA recombinase